MGRWIRATGLLLLFILAACTGSVSPLPDADDQGADDGPVDILPGDDGVDSAGDGGDGVLPADSGQDFDLRARRLPVSRRPLATPRTRNSTR